MRRTRRMVLATALLLGGCQPYAQVQIDLVDQTRKGVTLCATSLDRRTEDARKLAELRRRQLDEAFDQDVREARTLSPDWIIEHRKAYAVGVDALTREQSSALNAVETERRTLNAMDESLQKLRWLQQIQLQWTLPIGGDLFKGGTP